MTLLRSLIEELLKFRAALGSNCKQLKSKDLCVKGTAMQGLITISPRGPFKQMLKIRGLK